MEEIKFGYSNVRPERMNDTETVILNRYSSEMADLVDPVDLVECLYKMKFINREFHDEIYKKWFNLKWSKKKLCEYLISELSNVCSLYTLINILTEIGYDYVARKLLEMLILPKSEYVLRVSRVDTSNRKQVQQFFKGLKRKVWNAEFKNPLENLRTLAQRLQSSMLAEVNVHKRQILADKVVAVLGAEIDAHAITFDTELSEHALFRDLREIVPETTNTMVTDVILYGRRANACAIGKHFRSSEKYLQQAKSYSAFMTPCLELANMIYCEVYVRLWQFEEKPCDEIRESLVQMAEVGIECLREEEEEIRLLWTRMFLLRMVFCLLGIGNRASIIESCKITPYCLVKARNILEILNNTLDDMDTRREMFYRMAYARLLELEGNIGRARISIKESLKLASEGKFKEEKFIGHYKEKIGALFNMQNNGQNTCVVLSPESFDKSLTNSLSANEGSSSLHMNRPVNSQTRVKRVSSPVNSNTSDKRYSSLVLIPAPRLGIQSFEEKSMKKELDLEYNSFQQIKESNTKSMSVEDEESQFEMVYLERATELNTDSFQILT